MDNINIGTRGLLTLNHKAIIFMRERGMNASAIASFLSKKEGKEFKYLTVHRFLKEIENPQSLEVIQRNAEALELIHSHGANAFDFLQLPQARPQASQASPFGEPTFGAPNISWQAETVQIPTLQKDTPSPLKNHAQNQWFGSASQAHPPKSVDVGEIETKGLQKDTHRSVEEEIFELLNTRRTAHSKEDPTPRTSLPLYEKYKGRGFSRALDARQIELSEAAFGSSEFELEDTRDQLRTALIESRPTYSDEALREIYPDVLQVFKHAPTHRQQLKDKIRMLVEFREVKLDREEYYSLEDASSVIGVQIVSRRLMLAIILAYKEIYETKKQK